MPSLLDQRQVRRGFDRAAAGFDAAAALPGEVRARLLGSLDYLDDTVPAVVLDLGSGTGHAAAAMKKRWPKSQVLALDLSLAWMEYLPAVFAGLRRVLRPGGLLLCSSFGPETLGELQAAFTGEHEPPQPIPLLPIAGFGDAMVAAGFRDPVLDRDLFTLTWPDLRALLRELRATGMGNALARRRRGLTGRGRFAAASAACEALRDEQGRLPSTWEVIYAHAWAPAPGAPIREGGHDVASVPLAQIPIRRRT